MTSAHVSSNSFTAHGYTICTTQPLDDDEREALTAYLSMLRKSQDRKRGVIDLDQGRGR